MDKVGVSSQVLIDSSLVILEGVWDCNSAGNWSSLVDLLQHGFFSLEGSKLIDFVHVVTGRDEAGLVRLAVLALDDWGTLGTVSVASGSVDGAGLVSEFVVVHELVGGDGITTIAAEVVGGAGYHNLRRDVDVWPLSISSDLDSVGEG